MKSTYRLMVALTVAIVAILIMAVAHMLTAGGRAKGEPQAAFDAEFLTRPDGYPGLMKHYGFEFSSSPRQMDPGLMYRALADEAVDVIDAFATDGRIPAYGLMVLEDDKQFFPPYYAAPVIRVETTARLPQLVPLLRKLGDRLDDQEMQALNYEADEKGRKADEIAREWLVGEGLIASNATARAGTAGSITVGSKHFTEQEILGEIMSILIECKSDIKVTRQLNLGGTMICFSALKAGDLDLYAEYTGTGLVNILEEPVMNDPDKAYATVKTRFEEEFGLLWLDPFGFNNTYTLTMRRDHAKALGLQSISDLAEHVNKNASLK